MYPNRIALFYGYFREYLTTPKWRLEKFMSGKNNKETRKHSSRMRTACFSQRPPWTEIPQTETQLDSDPFPGQRPLLLDKDPSSWTETPSPGQRPQEGTWDQGQRPPKGKWDQVTRQEVTSCRHYPHPHGQND